MSRAVYDALIPIGHGILQARLSTPISPGGWVIMGCSRRHHPPAMQDVPFGETGLATMCLHLLPSIDVLPSLESELARQLTQQLILAARWLRAEVSESHIPIGLFGAYQDAAIAVLDANGDGQLDIYVTSGGYHDFQPGDERLQDQLYISDGNLRFTRSSGLPKLLTASSVVAV